MATTFDCSPSAIQLVHKGATLNIGDARDALALSDGDTMLAMPKRKAPSAHIVAAALTRQNGGREAEEEREEEEEDAPAQLPAGAPRWELAVTRWLRSRWIVKSCPLE